MVVSEIGLNDLSLIWDTRYRQSRPPWKFCISDDSCLDERKKKKKKKRLTMLCPIRLISRPGYFSEMKSARIRARSLIEEVAGTLAIKTSTPFDSNTSLIPLQWDI